MNVPNDFEFKQKKYIPIFPKANGKPTIYIEGYPYEDDEPMSATGFHGEQIGSLSEQLTRYFQINPHIYIGVDSFIYYREGDITKFVAPDIYVVFGVNKYPQRRSFYTWSEGAVPTTIFEFLSDSTAYQDRHGKVEIYLGDMGSQEYFIHQPEMEKPAEFRGWRRSPECFEIFGHNLSVKHVIIWIRPRYAFRTRWIIEMCMCINNHILIFPCGGTTDIQALTCVA